MVTTTTIRSVTPRTWGWLIIDADGEPYSTTNAGVASLAITHRDAESVVDVHWSNGWYYRDITFIQATGRSESAHGSL